MRTLLRVQALRQKREADPQALDRGERTEHHMLTLMTEAISTQPAISHGDPESQATETEILPRHAPTNPEAIIPGQTTHSPGFVSPNDPKSCHAETETHARLSASEPEPHAPMTQPVVTPWSRLILRSRIPYTGN